MIETLGDFCDFIDAALAEVGYDHETEPSPGFCREDSLRDCIESKMPFWQADSWRGLEFERSLYKAKCLTQSATGDLTLQCFDCWRTATASATNVCEHLS